MAGPCLPRMLAVCTRLTVQIAGGRANIAKALQAEMCSCWHYKHQVPKVGNSYWQ